MTERPDPTPLYQKFIDTLLEKRFTSAPVSSFGIEQNGALPELWHVIDGAGLEWGMLSFGLHICDAPQGGVITLNALWTEPDIRGRGLARAVLTEFCAIAAEVGLPVVVEPTPLDPQDGVTDVHRLVRLYSGLGFTKIRDDPMTMRKNPPISY